jgi:hypothetical protein
MKRPEIKGIKKEVLEYIEHIESELASFKNDGAKRLVSELSGIAGDFANDISNIRNGKGVSTFITDDKNDMIMERILKLVDKLDKIKLLAQLSSTDEETTKVTKKIVKRPEDLIKG